MSYFQIRVDVLISFLSSSKYSQVIIKAMLVKISVEYSLDGPGLRVQDSEGFVFEIVSAHPHQTAYHVA